MKDSTLSRVSRVLVVDDNPAIHNDFRKILCPAAKDESILDKFEAACNPDAKRPLQTADFEVDSAFQGAEGLLAVERAIAEGRPYAMAFVDVRMPPGWDGIETISRIWQADPDIQVVLCTAYSDFSWEEINVKLRRTDQLIILKKPFEVVEARQMAHAFTEKWRLRQQVRDHLSTMEQTVNSRTAELRESEGRYRSLFENMIDGFAYLSDAF